MKKIERPKAKTKGSLPEPTRGSRAAVNALARLIPKPGFASLESLLASPEAKKLDLRRSTLRRYLAEELRAGNIFDAGKGWYSSLPEPLTFDSAPVKNVAATLKSHFPKLDFSCWSTQQLTPYMQHLLAKHLIFVSTSRAGLETVSQVLEEAGYTAHVNPGGRDAKKVAGGEKVVVLRPSVSEEPGAGHGPYAVPEKVLVDLFIEVRELGFIDGMEFSIIFGNILKNKRISEISKMFRYLERRLKPKKLANSGFLDGNESLIGDFSKKSPIRD